MSRVGGHGAARLFEEAGPLPQGLVTDGQGQAKLPVGLKGLAEVLIELGQPLPRGGAAGRDGEEGGATGVPGDGHLHWEGQRGAPSARTDPPRGLLP